MTHPLTPREKVALKPCPMCGMSDSDDNATQESGLHIQSFRSPAGGDACRVQCVCGASGPPSREEWQAAEKWNRRAALASSGDHAELARLKAAMSKSNDEICQSLGKALGYPWFKDDQRNFPGATEGNGVCVGDHVAESIADEAASRISALLAEITALRAESENARTVVAWANNSLFGSCGYFHGEPFDGLHLARPIETLKARATEAERKLAEAVGLLRECLPWIRKITDLYGRVSAWLSKEAERG